MWLQKDLQFHRHDILDQMSPHCDLELEDSKPIFLHDTMAHGDALPYQVRLRKIQQLRRYPESPNGLTFTWWGCCCLCPTQTNRACPLRFILFLVCFCFHGPFNCISFHKFSQQLSALSVCSYSLISALLALSTIFSLYESLPQP